MPNHCDQTVYLHGASKVVYELYQYLSPELCNDPRFCSVISPMPLQVLLDPTTKRKHGQHDLEIQSAHEWRNENWNTKWDVCEVEIEDKIEFSEDKDTAWFTFRCWTAWAPPVPVWDKLFAMGIEVQAEYVDEGGWFEGEYALGQDNCWRPEIEEDDGVASDEEFGLEDTIDVFKNLMKETMG